MDKFDKARYYQILNLVQETINLMGNYSFRAQNAVMAIIAHESLFATMREQVISFDTVKDREYKLSGKPYAAGIGGIEKPTHDDLWKNSDNIQTDFYRVFAVRKRESIIDFDRLRYDDKYSIFMIRKKLHMIIESIPEDLDELDAYLIK